MGFLDILNKRVSRRDILKKSAAASAVAAAGAIGVSAETPLTEKVSVEVPAVPVRRVYPQWVGAWGTAPFFAIGTADDIWHGGNYDAYMPAKQNRKRLGNCKQCGAPLGYDSQCPYCGTWTEEE